MVPVSDGSLLRDYWLQQNEDAFAEVVRRHSGMVMKAIRTIVRSESTAEDVSQVTFMALSRKAGTFERAETVAGWLHQVAVHMAKNRLREEKRREAREGKAAMTAERNDAAYDTSDAAIGIMHEELSRMPPKYRIPIILHYLEDKPYQQAAGELGIKVNAFSVRLARAREKLRGRLVGRGVRWGQAALLAAFGQSVSGAELSPALIAATCKAARLMAAGEPIPAEIASPKVLVMMKDALRILFWEQVKGVATVCAGLVLLGALAVSLPFAISRALEQGGQPAKPIASPPEPVLEGGAGPVRSLAQPAVTAKGGCVHVWGTNPSGLPGAGTAGDRDAPVPVRLADGTKLAGCIAVAAGYSHTVALKKDGSLMEWGLLLGKPGAATTGEDRRHPVPVTLEDGRLFTDVTAVAAGNAFSMALSRDRTVWMWGFNDRGQLGDGTRTSRAYPAPVRGLSDVVAIAAGGYHGVAITADSAVWTWGLNRKVDGRPTEAPRLPTKVRLRDGSIFSEAVAIDAHQYMTAVLQKNGGLWMGDMGRGFSFEPAVDFVQVCWAGGAPLSGFTAIAFQGPSSLLALRSDSSVWSCGMPGATMMGSGQPLGLPAPVRQSDNAPLDHVRALAGGGYRGLALKLDGSVWSILKNEATPVRMPDGSPLSGVVAVAVGLKSVYAIKEEDSP